MAKRLIIILFIILATVGYAAYQALVLEDKLASEQILMADSVISQMPDVTFPKIFESNESVSTNTSFQGKNIVVHFWATWCGPCEGEFPKFMTLFKSMDLSNSVFLFVAVNDQKNDISKFLKKFPELESRVFLVSDDQSIYQKQFGTYKLPETYVFDAQKKLIRKFTGPQDWDTPYFKSFFQDLK